MRLGQDSAPAAGGDNQLQLFRRVHAAAALQLRPEGLQDDLSGSGHESQERRGDGHENVHRAGNRQRNSLGALQRDGLGNDLAQNHHQIGDQHERSRDRNTVRVKLRVRKRTEQRLQHVRHRSLADPAQAEAGNRHSKLHCVEDVVELLMQLLDGARADAVRRNHLLQSRLADAHQSEFRGHEERVGCDQQNNHYDAQHSEGNHEAEILPSAEEASAVGQERDFAGVAIRFSPFALGPSLLALSFSPQAPFKLCHPDRGLQSERRDLLFGLKHSFKPASFRQISPPSSALRRINNLDIIPLAKYSI